MKAKQPPGNIICTGCVSALSTHFPRGFDSLPDTEEADNPHCQETQRQVPLQGPDILDPGGDAQHVASAECTERQGQGSLLNLKRIRGSRLSNASRLLPQKAIKFIMA